MVSNARLDLPDPESPVTTTSLSRGISSDTFLRLCTRAPWTDIVVRTAVFGVLEAIAHISQMNERQFQDLYVAPLRELHRRRGGSNQTTIGKILAGRRNPFDIESPLKVGLDL